MARSLEVILPHVVQVTTGSARGEMRVVVGTKDDGASGGKRSVCGARSCVDTGSGTSRRRTCCCC